MPEGDTIWLAARRLHGALAGTPLIGSDFRVPQLATVNLTGWTVENVVARGKHLLVRLHGPPPGDAPAGQAPAENALTLHSHLRMDGSWHLYRPGARRRGGPDWQVRAVLETAEREAVGYRLPVLELLPTAQEAQVVGHLGPDLLGPDWDLDEAVRRLARAPGREIGPALLDQRNLAGLGNLYVNEALFLAWITPWTPVGDVVDLRALVGRAQRLLDRNKTVPEQSTTGDVRRGHQHWVYERAGSSCRRCATPIRSAESGQPPTARIAFWCPGCQAGPAPRPAPRREPRPAPVGRRAYRP